MMPFDADIGGRLVRVAAGGTSKQENAGETGSVPVQRACDALSPGFPDAPSRLLPLWIAYLDKYGPVNGHLMDVCAAALECAYHEGSGRQADLRKIAAKHGVTTRQCRMALRRIRSAVAAKEDKQP